MDQWNRIESRNKPKFLWPINIRQRGKQSKMEQIQPLQQIQSWIATDKKINSKWIKDLNISCDSTKVIEENTGRKISDIPHSNIFTDMSPKGKNKQMGPHQNKKLLHG